MSSILLDMVEDNDVELSFEDVDKGPGFGWTSPEDKRSTHNQVEAIIQKHNQVEAIIQNRMIEGV